MSKPQEQPKPAAQASGILPGIFKSGVEAPPPISEQLVSLKTGDYLVHVFIEETRGLRHPKNADSTVDPIIEIKALGRTRYSRVQKNVGGGATFWGDHYFFEKNFDTTLSLEHEKIKISVMDHSTFGFNAVIGVVELNIPTIYYRENHVLEYQWAALSGLTKKFQEVLGFIKFSVGVFATGDEQLVLKEEKVTDSGGPNKVNILYPPQIKTTPYQIRIKVFRGEKWKKMDTFGKTDPYVLAIYGGLEAKTSVLKLTLDPVWNEEILLPASLPTVSDKVCLKFYDWENGTPDELMGSAFFDINHIMNPKSSGHPFWVNIYGSPTGANATYEKLMNETPEIATEWKGRVQLAMTMKEEKRPILDSGPIKHATELIKKASEFPKETYELRAEIHYAMNLRKDGEDYSVVVRWGPGEVATKKKTSKNRMIEIYESLLMSTDFPGNSNDEIPDVFIYINNGQKNLSFTRKSFTAFRQLDAKARVFYLIVDRSVTTTREDLAGIVKMRIYISKKTEKPNFVMYGWDKPVSKPLVKNNWKLHCNVYQAKELIPADASGLSDPYINIYYAGTSLDTKIVYETLNPIWNQRLEFPATFDVVQDAPPIFLTVWDKDETSQDDFIGSVVIDLKEEYLNPEKPLHPTWFDVKFGKGGATQGKILMSICCYNRPDIIPKGDIAPETEKYHINMKILGLRQLESIGFLPVRRAFVRFDLDSLRGTEEKAHLPEKKYRKTEPVNPGANPNILTVVNIEADLPVDPDYAPSLSCVVFDYIFKGLSQPMLGTFYIPMGDCMKETSKQYADKVDKITKLFLSTQQIKKLMEDNEKRIQEEQKPEKGILSLVVDQIKEKDKDEKLEESKAEVDLVPSITTDPSKALGRFMDPFINTLASIKQKKGFLPGESDDVKISLFEHLDPEFTGLPDPLESVCEENKISQSFVIFSHFTPEGNEIEKPNPDKYMELGHNNKEGTKKKHYRYWINTELEDSEFVDPSPFISIPIYRGRKVREDGVIANLFKKGEDFRCVGYFKAMVNVMKENEKITLDSKIQHVAKFARTKGLDFSDDEFLRKRDVIVRVYVIKAENLADKDDDSNSDPYLVVKLGDTEYNEQKNYQQDNPNPLFNKCYEFPATLPGASKLSIELWDYDHLDADDLIGRTVIDIEDRWYSSKWRSLRYVPIETRNLYHPSSNLSQGSVKLWVEILPKDLPRPPVMNISPKEHIDYELRVVVWECKDVPNVDLEDVSDIYITGKLIDGQMQRTDTHFRSQNGKGNFNWRMVFPIKLPMKKHRITFQIWDKDILSSDDFISEATFDFDLEAARAFETEDRIMGPSGKDLKFWIPCTGTKVVGHQPGVEQKMGSILLSMSLVPKKEADLAPVGQGRSKPNQHPHLEAPEGRFELSWNVIKLYKQLIGPLARKQIIIWSIIIICAFIFIMLVPIIAADLITEPINDEIEEIEGNIGDDLGDIGDSIGGDEIHHQSTEEPGTK